MRVLRQGYELRKVGIRPRHLAPLWSIAGLSALVDNEQKGRVTNGRGPTDAAACRIRWRSWRAGYHSLGLPDRAESEPGTGRGSPGAGRGSRPLAGNSDTASGPEHRCLPAGLIPRPHPEERAQARVSKDGPIRGLMVRDARRRAPHHEECRRHRLDYRSHRRYGPARFNQRNDLNRRWMPCLRICARNVRSRD